MTDREKLRDLIGRVQDEGVSYVDCFSDDDKPDYIGNYELADYLIANGVTFATDTNVGSKWISVEDEKPKRRDNYFIAYKFGNSDMRFYGEAFWNDDIPDNGYVKGNHFSNEGVDGMRVTHWMKIPKLPELPKED